MTHEDAGHYAAKRKGFELNKEIAAWLKERASESKISCADAHAIAVKLKVTPAEVGAAIDLLEFRITKCQLGLFGYGLKKNIPELSGDIDPGIESAIRSLAVNKRITCESAWGIAKKYGVAKNIVTAVGESIKIKISGCQLGAFR